MTGPESYRHTLTARTADDTGYSTLIVYVAHDTPATVGLSLTGGIRSTVALTRNEATELGDALREAAGSEG
ncbi:MAG: hypothetical protein GEV09_14325 [Pseudonocardiaceae bacterium]|nr:hypothetical protein [Pseudonocardiaceae bacterium]